jgi:uroporphyrinogen-III decarboxylase
MADQSVILDPAKPLSWFLAESAKREKALPLWIQMHDHAMVMNGLSARQYYFDPHACVTAFTALSAYYRFDVPLILIDSYNFEAEAMGAKMIYSDHAMPTLDFREPFIATYADLAKVKAPENWLDHGRVRFAWDVIKGQKALGVQSGTWSGLFSLAVGLRTYPMLIRDMRREPAFAHELFTCLADEILPSYLKAQAEYTGLQVSVCGDAWAAFPNLSPALMEEWLVPYQLRLFGNTIKFGIIPANAGAADYVEENVAKFDKQVLWECFDVQAKLAGRPTISLGMGRWHEYPLEPVLEYLEPLKSQGVRVTITACVNARLLRDGPVEAIVGNIKRFISAFGRDHDLILLLVNIPADTPPDHVHAAVAAVNAYGKLPLAENLDDVQFEIPHRESYQEYIDKMTNGKGLQY